MHRRPFLGLLRRYQRLHPAESARVARVRALVESHPDCFERTCLPGHVTASAWIVSADGRRFLLTHHRKLDRWLQLGGHTDGDGDVARAALREAREESGMRDFDFVSPDPAPLPVDVDVHSIPSLGGEPRHEHHDVRFLLVARPGQALVRSPESHALRWFERDAFAALAPDESLERLGRKAFAWLDRFGVPAPARRTAPVHAEANP